MLSSGFKGNPAVECGRDSNGDRAFFDSRLSFNLTACCLLFRSQEYVCPRKGERLIGRHEYDGIVRDGRNAAGDSSTTTFTTWMLYTRYTLYVDYRVSSRGYAGWTCVNVHLPKIRLHEPASHSNHWHNRFSRCWLLSF